MDGPYEFGTLKVLQFPPLAISGRVSRFQRVVRWQCKGVFARYSLIAGVQEFLQKGLPPPAGTLISNITINPMNPTNPTKL